MAGANGRPAHDSRDVDTNAVPTGWRPSVDKQEAKELATRDPHVQTIEDSDVYLLEPFAGCQFVAHINRKSSPVPRRGDLGGRVFRPPPPPKNPPKTPPPASPTPASPPTP